MGATTTTSKQQIIDDVNEYIRERGGGYGAWYVGISIDARDRLFNGHKVREKGDSWIYRQANSSTTAREIEDHFVNTLGTDGGTGGGDYPHEVYAYKKAPHTSP